ncbi:26S proteasome regulatory subunit N12 [Kwoniella mangroviensis CBS 8886]|nr:26S proteasome regulatory subunit N12 [Kwoniella mangroviensis CBS 8886]
MSVDLQQSLSELQQLFDAPGGSRDEVSKRLAKLKLELAQTGLYFAPPTANPQDLVAARSILEIGSFHSLRSGNLKSYAQYNFALQPFYLDLSSIIPESPNRPITLGLHLLALLSEGLLTEFHTLLETLKVEQLSDIFVKLPVDLEKWLMEGAYNKVYRAKDRVPREEFGFLLERLMGTVRGQIASTIETSYPSLPLKSAATLLFFKPNETSQLNEFAQSRGWELSPSQQVYTFPNSIKPDIALAALQQSSETKNTSAVLSLEKGGIKRGTPMVNMVGPALKLAQQLEAIV